MGKVKTNKKTASNSVKSRFNLSERKSIGINKYEQKIYLHLNDSVNTDRRISLSESEFTNLLKKASKMQKTIKKLKKDIDNESIKEEKIIDSDNSSCDDDDDSD